MITWVLIAVHSAGVLAVCAWLLRLQVDCSNYRVEVAKLELDAFQQTTELVRYKSQVMILEGIAEHMVLALAGKMPEGLDCPCVQEFKKEFTMPDDLPGLKCSGCKREFASSHFPNGVKADVDASADPDLPLDFLIGGTG